MFDSWRVSNIFGERNAQPGSPGKPQKNPDRAVSAISLAKLAPQRRYGGSILTCPGTTGNFFLILDPTGTPKKGLPRDFLFHKSSVDE